MLAGTGATPANGVAGRRRWTFTGLLFWYLGFAIPGLGMFSTAYIVFGRFARLAGSLLDRLSASCLSAL
eukprot:364556-Chlamydomonas_euryale.AAC.28